MVQLLSLITLLNSSANNNQTISNIQGVKEITGATTNGTNALYYKITTDGKRCHTYLYATGKSINKNTDFGYIPVAYAPLYQMNTYAHHSNVDIELTIYDTGDITVHPATGKSFSDQSIYCSFSYMLKTPLY